MTWSLSLRPGASPALPTSVLLIDRDADRRQVVAAALESAGMVVTAHAASAEVLEAGRPVACDVLLVGLLLPDCLLYTSRCV